METTTDGRKIYVFPNLLPKDICLKWTERLLTLPQLITRDEDFARDIYETIKGLVGEFPIRISGHRSEVTIGKRGVPHTEHFDTIYGDEKWKLLCYLNDVENGGTDFKNGTEWISIRSGLGTVVLFDITLFHRGSPQAEPKTKYTVGIRLQE